MQQITHKLTTLTIPQKFFIEKSIEILYRGTIDTYRVRVKNPKSILSELKSAIEAFQKGQLKHFISITGKKNHTTFSKYGFKDEAIDLIEAKNNYLKFNSVSEKYFITLLKELSESNYKQTKNSLSIVLKDNIEYADAIITGLKEKLNATYTTDEELITLLGDISKAINYLFTELIDIGFSKNFWYRYMYGLFVNSLSEGDSFNDRFNEFENRISSHNNNYDIIFRIDTIKKVQQSIKSTTHQMSILENIDDITLEDPKAEIELSHFKPPKDTRLFIKCNITAHDYLAALKSAKRILSESLDLLNLGYGNEKLELNNRVLVIDTNNPKYGRFQQSTNFLDGKYSKAQTHYLNFIDKVPDLLSKENVNEETKEKVKSAIRYLRLGNQSIEVEHKFINYWIGLEYLFSNYESDNTINRIKEYLVTCHSLAYVKRNLLHFHKLISNIDSNTLASISTYTAHSEGCIQKPEFYKEVFEKLKDIHPLIAQRSYSFWKIISHKNGKGNWKEYISTHKKNLVIHLTRIYNIRNEIIHDAATDTNNESITSNLRYYLTFMLNGIIDFLCQDHDDNVSIEDYFTLNEILLGNIEHDSCQLDSLLNVDCVLDFIS